MPSEKILSQKQAQVKELAEKLKSNAAGVIVDYKGIDVENDTKLRKSLREAGVDYFVVKNSLLSLAADQVGLSDLKDVLKGSTAIALSAEDPIEVSKLLYKQTVVKPEVFNLKAGFVDGKVIDAATVEQYAKLPTKEALLSQLVFLLASPMQSLAIAISEIAKKNEIGEPVEAIAENVTETVVTVD